MRDRNRPSDTVEVEELRFEQWAGPGSATEGWTQPPDREPPEWLERCRRWLRTHGKRLAAGFGALVLVVVVTVLATSPGTGGDDDASPAASSTVAPPTTRPRAIPTAPPTTEADDTTATGDGGTSGGALFPDFRAALRTVPDGYEVTGADRIDSEPIFPAPFGYQLFTARGATRSSGPWLEVRSVARADEPGLGRSFAFSRPPTATTINGFEALLGPTTRGDELTIFRTDEMVVAVSARGLPPNTTTTVAQAVVVVAEAVSLPATALPAGLEPRTVHDVQAWVWNWSPGTRSAISYQRTDLLSYLTLLTQPFDAARDMTSDAAFYLDDVRYASIGGEPAIAGTTEGATPYAQHTVMWRVGDVQLSLQGGGMSLDDALQLAGDVVVADHPGWRDSIWEEAQVDATRCCSTQSDAFSPPADVGSPVHLDDGTTWVLHAEVTDDGLRWTFSSAATGIQARTPGSVPDLQVAASYTAPWSSTGLYVMAVAVFDRGSVGAVLRFTTNGAVPERVEVALQPDDDLDELAPYVVAGAVLPWVDGGFTAELLAPDGSVLLTRTDADLS